MVPAWVSLPLAVAVVVAYFTFRTATMRPRPVVPGPATPDLRDEPPAVVNLLVNRLMDAPQVASATLLDLAARRVVEIHQVADDADHTLVRFRGRALPDHRPSYERRVVDRIRGVAVDRLTPVARLVERYAEGGQHWQQRLVRDTVLDARRRGLIRRTAGGCATGVVAAGLVAAAVLAPLLPPPGTEDFQPMAIALSLGWLVLTLVGGLLLPAVSIGERAAELDRYTPEGRRATAHWLGVAAWLRAHDALRDLPPGAVAVWDRYVAYGVALDVMPHAVRVLDFETAGHADTLSSNHTGQPRQVRVAYPRPNRLLRPAGPVAAQARLVWAVTTLPLWIGAAIGLASAVTVPFLRELLVCLAVVQAARSGYRLVRATLDLARPTQLTGTVLALSIANRQHTADHTGVAGTAIPDLPTHFYVVVDDGTTDLLRPWIVNRDVARGHPVGAPPLDPAGTAGWHERLTRPGFRPGDRVRLVGQPWSRFTSSLVRLPDPAPRPEAGRP